MKLGEQTQAIAPIEQAVSYYKKATEAFAGISRNDLVGEIEQRITHANAVLSHLSKPSLLN